MKMIRIYTVVIVLFNLLPSLLFAGDSHFSPRTKDLVRAKLWHQGIEITEDSGKNNFDAVVDYPEELIVAVELLDQEKR